MSHSVSGALIPDGLSRPARGRRAVVLPAMFVTLALLSLSFGSLVGEVLRDGVLFDNDDAMRLVQVRDWTNGQGWFDLTQARVDPPHSPRSHWSRMVDVPLAGLIRFASLATDAGTAERIAAILWPALLLAAFAFGLLSLAARLFSVPIVVAGAAILALNPLLTFQFAPGRIDHHGAQMLLVLALSHATILAIAEGRRRASIAAGLVAALMLAIGLETLPFIAAAALAFGLTWVIRPTERRSDVAAFGAALALGTAAAYAINVAPARWGEAACDALSAPWLWLAGAGGLALCALAALPPPASRAGRLVLASAAAALPCGLFAAVWPDCLAGPYADVDPLVERLWLSGVGEATPALDFVAQDPAFLFFLTFPLVGLLGLAGALRDRERRLPALVLLGFGAVGAAVSLTQMRGLPFAAIFGFFGWLYLIDCAAGLPARRAFARWAGAGLVLLLALPFIWTAVGTSLPSRPDAAEAEPGRCHRPADLRGLAGQPAGLVAAPVRLGPRILVASPHSVLAAPYHRNNRGNRAALDLLTAGPPEAEALARRGGVDYLALCLADPQTATLAASAPTSLLAELVRGTAPDWLAPVQVAGPIRAWRVLPSEANAAARR